jgi:hypothetical protein
MGKPKYRRKISSDDKEMFGNAFVSYYLFVQFFIIILVDLSIFNQTKLFHLEFSDLFG